MKRALVVITAMVMALTVAGIAHADPIETTATGPEVLNASGTATFASKSGRPAVSCVGAHGPLLAASAPLPLPRPTVLPPVVADIRAALA